LSVFAGGFTLEAARRCAAGAVEAEEVLVLLGNLAEQSLVWRRPSPEGRTRYRMLEPVRQYAWRSSARAGGGRVRRRHADTTWRSPRRPSPTIKGHEQVAWLDRLEAENDNLRAAIQWALGRERRKPPPGSARR
jgi:predicted ATPase